ncbi:MAG TPA: MauE/DoxX family redox-associated membrane protein [Mycobacteriales bacterium]|jgi:hypothetical protein|nr:MauE/DoxX family redox-associated membrane protein [Mycobacteriales bacterium]
MEPATAPLLVAGTLLAIGGTPKIRRPAPTSGALRSVGLRVPDAAVRAGGLVEAALGVGAVLTGSRLLAASVAASYLGFSAFVAVALSRGGVVASCGCLGRSDTPPTRSHLALTLGLATAAAVAAVTGASGLIDLGWSAHDLALLALAGLTAWLAWMVLALLPHARSPRRTVKEH